MKRYSVRRQFPCNIFVRENENEKWHKCKNILKLKLFPYNEGTVFFFILPFLFNLVIWSPRTLQSTYHQINVPMQEENVYLKVLAVEEQIAISEGSMIRILQRLYVTAL